jgi:hypothetical protein
MSLHRFAMLPRPWPGSPFSRVDRFEACATYMPNMAAMENEYHSSGLITISIYDDPWYHIMRDTVQEAVSTWLGVPRHDVGVDFFPPKGFLLLLPSPAIRDQALTFNDGITIGRVKLHLIPWTRMAGAKAAKLSFKVCIFIEGIPHHAWQAATICQLLPPGTLLVGLDDNFHNNSEASCCCTIVWSQNPDEFTLEGGPLP